MRSPIYPTNLAIALVAAGVPLSLLAGAIMQSLWAAGFAWLVLVLLLTFSDAILSVTGATPQLDVELPSLLQVGRQARVFVRAAFEGASPSSVELALAVSDRINVEPAQLAGVPGEEQAFILSPQRRGEASIDRIWPGGADHSD